MRRNALIASIAALAMLAVYGGPASAAPSVEITGITLSGGTATVTGLASFPAITGPEDVGGTHTPFTDPTVANTLGLSLTGASIQPVGGGLRFIWSLASLPPQIPPEIVRYTWSFKIGTTQYQLQGKRTNLASVTTVEDPVGHIQQAAAQRNFFQLRGACQTSYQGLPVAGCYHLAWLNGTFDIPNKQVSMDLPFETKDQIGRIVAADFKPGAVLESNLTAGSSITANVQAVVSTTNTSDYINGWNPYFIGGRVQAVASFAGDDPTLLTYGPVATLSGGTFQVTVPGVGGANDTIYVRACNGGTCAYASQLIV